MQAKVYHNDRWERISKTLNISVHGQIRSDRVTCHGIFKRGKNTVIAIQQPLPRIPGLEMARKTDMVLSDMALSDMALSDVALCNICGLSGWQQAPSNVVGHAQCRPSPCHLGTLDATNDNFCHLLNTFCTNSRTASFLSWFFGLSPCDSRQFFVPQSLSFVAPKNDARQSIINSWHVHVSVCMRVYVIGSVEK